MSQIAYKALISTNKSYRWWILSFFQVTALALVGIYTRPYSLVNLWAVWLLVGLVLLPITTVGLWMDMETVHNLKPSQVSLKNFVRTSLVSAVFIMVAVGIMVAVRLMDPNWVLIIMLSGIVSGTITLAVLYSVLCKTDFFSSLILALDTWRKKISLAVYVALVVILANGAAFVLARSLWPEVSKMGEFPVFSHSATIWVLLVAFSVAIAYFAAFLNCFLVFLFLNIIQRKSQLEEISNEAVELAAMPTNQ